MRPVAGPPLNVLVVPTNRPAACVRDLGAGLLASANGDGYVERWARAIHAWCDLFGEGR